MAEKKASGGSEGYLLTEDEKKKVIKAVEDGNCAPLQQLIDRGWNLNQPLDRDKGNTPLHFASSLGRLAVVELFVQNGVDATVVNTDKQTAFDVCGDQCSTFFNNVDDETVKKIKKILEKHMQYEQHGGKSPPSNQYPGESRINRTRRKIYNFVRGTFRANLCASATKEKFGIALTLLCHGQGGANCPEHHCEPIYPTELNSQGELFFLAKYICKDEIIQKRSASIKVDRKLCENTGMRIDDWQSLEKGNLVLRVVMEVYQVLGENQFCLQSKQVQVKPFRRPESDTLPTGTINGADGGVIEYKDVQLRVPRNAISGDLNIEFVDQPLFARAVHYNTKGKAGFHSQGICLTGTDEDATFLHPVEIRVTVSAMLEKANDQRPNGKDFRILREKDGVVIDVTDECNARLHGEEIVFYCKTFSMVDIAWVADFTLGQPIVKHVFKTIKHFVETSYMCRICPYIKGRQDGGLKVKLFCHGVDVVCSDDSKHECASDKMRLTNSATLLFEVECSCLKDDERKHISSTELKLERDHCERACTIFAMIERFASALVNIEVQLCVKDLTFKETLLNRPVKVQVESASGTPSALLLTPNTKATISWAGGVIRCKEVQVRVPPNAISGHITIEFVDQPLLSGAVQDETNGKANLHCQGICVTCTDEDAPFSDPVEIRVTVRTMLEKANGQRLDSKSFRVLREKDGDVMDVTEDCKIRLHGEEIVFYCKTFSNIHLAWLADIPSIVGFMLRAIRHILETSYICKICPYLIGKQDQGIIVKLFCHGEQVECSGDLEHNCVDDSEKQRLPNEVTLWFEVECRCIENGKETTVSSKKSLKLYKSVCESTGKSFSKIMPGVKALVAGEVQLHVHALNYPDPLLDMSLKVHVHEISTVGTAPATHTASNTTGIGTCAKELHRELVQEVADSLVKEDFGRLKGLCKAWIKPALAEKITKTEELLEELEKQEIIKIGEYSKLMEMLGKLKLNVVKSCVDELSRRIKALGTDVSPSLT